jgi:N utilization substance protein B
VRDVLANKLDLDATITRHASGYKARELTVVDRNIIRMAITEVRSDISDASQATIVVEAMELARKYSAEEATKFIHGVLGSVFGHKRVPESHSSAADNIDAAEGQSSNE